MFLHTAAQPRRAMEAPDEVPSRDGDAARAGAADADRDIDPGFGEARLRQSELRLLPGDAAPRARRAPLPAAGSRSKAVCARRRLPLRAIAAICTTLQAG